MTKSEKNFFHEKSRIDNFHVIITSKGGRGVHTIIFYKDSRGVSPVADYINELESRADKDSRIKLNKIRDYVKALSINGTLLPETYCKHLDGDIWELRPIRDRILFATFIDGAFVLLHVFMKQTQKTPWREIEKAKRELADFKERWNSRNDDDKRI